MSAAGRGLRRALRAALALVRRQAPAAVAATVVLAVAGAGIAAVATGFPQAFRAVEQWNKDYVVLRTGTAAKALFDELVSTTSPRFVSDGEPGVETPLLWFNPKTQRLDVRVDCDAATQAGFVDPKVTAKLLNKLCDSDIGAAVINETRVWNRGLSLLAVRDDHVDDAEEPQRCADGVTTFAAYIPRGCRPSFWTLNVARAREDSEIDSRTPDPPAAEVHGYLARPVVPGFRDWARFDAAPIGGGDAEAILSATFQKSDRPITVDVIGQFVSIEIGGAGREVKTRELCHRIRPTISCKSLRPTTPRATRLELPAFDAKTRVRIRVRPITVAPVALRRLGKIETDLRLAPKTSQLRNDETFRLTTHIVLRCQTVDDDDLEDGVVTRLRGKRTGVASQVSKKFCGPIWETSVARGLSTPGTAEIVAGDGDKSVTLTAVRQTPVTPRKPAGEMRDTVVPSDDAYRLGLVPVIGLGEADRNSLIGQATRLAPPGGAGPAVRITIDPALQTVANQQLVSLMTRSADMKDLTKGFVPNADDVRRGAVVLIDAGPKAADPERGGEFDAQAGRILAAATWPQPPRQPANEWDVLAAEAYRPSESPLAARAWSQNDSFYQPGSTFKPMIALAAIERAARGEKVFVRALGVGGGQTGLRAEEIPQVFGTGYGFAYRSTELKVPVGDDDEETFRSISNSGKAPLCAMLPGAGKEGCPAAGRINLRDAMRTSNNMYFARLALLVDEDHVMERRGGRTVEIQRDDPASAPPLVIARLAARIMGPQPLDLAPALTALSGRSPSPSSRLIETVVRTDAARADLGDRRFNLAQAGIGQSTQATPLSMATLMASIATGKIVRPRLTPETATTTPVSAASAPASGEPPPPAAGDPLFDPGERPGSGPFDAALADDLLRGLRGALRAVVQAGTGAEAFKSSPLRERTFGKTGTAQVSRAAPRPGETAEEAGNRESNTVWFVGWVEGLGQGPLRARRVAFACLVTHVSRSGATATGGGSVCAPLVQRVLARYESERQAAR